MEAGGNLICYCMFYLGLPVGVENKGYADHADGASDDELGLAKQLIPPVFLSKELKR